jgi:DNA-directed RNA polymerase specialized sigma24 family protein
MGEELSALIDCLLVPLWQAASAEDAEQSLAHLLTTQVEPVIKGVVHFKLRLSNTNVTPEADDIRQEALTEVLAELRKFQSQPEHHPIGDVRGLAATIAYRACYRWLRRQSPRRHALKNRLQYLLTRQPGLALWPNAEKKLLGGLAVWRGKNERAAAASLRQLAGDESLKLQAGRLGGQSVATLNELLVAVFAAVNLPIELDDLAHLTAELLQVKDEPIASLSENREGSESGKDSEGQMAGIKDVAVQADIAWQTEKRIFLQRVWEEAQLLPPVQRAALLLNLRDDGGRGCIALFPAVGIATMRQLAVALEMPIEKFAELWNQLPLDDATIAGLFNLTRQQIINARKAARERLARRLRGFF